MAKRVQSINAEIPLPDTSVHHIQSFLISKQAAQTTLLSKSWYQAWLTRPDLDFRSPDFPTTDEFWEFTEKTIQRYEQSNLMIDSFRLQTSFYIDTVTNSALLDNLIVRAMKMGPLVFTLELNFQGTTHYDLPDDVLASETLTSLSLKWCSITRLSLKWCSIERGAGGEVKCSKLKSLNLYRVVMEVDKFWDLITGNPEIEEMVLSQSHCIFDRNLDYPKLRPYIDIRTHRFESMTYLMSLREFHKLRCLVLERMDIKASFFDNFSAKFPCLKDFSANNCNVEKGIQICSPSLERVTFVLSGGVLKAKFDIPSLLKFTFSGSRLPSLSFEKASNEWEAVISIACRRHPSYPWFLDLKRFLTKLRLSRISLSLKLRCNVENGPHYGGDSGNVRSYTKHAEVENLMVHEESLICNALLDCLFWSCRPRFIYHYWLPESCKGWNENNDGLKILCEKLVGGGVSEDCPVPNLNVASLLGLVDVNAECIEENMAEWQPMPLATLLDASIIPENKQKIRFNLKWE